MRSLRSIFIVVIGAAAGLGCLALAVVACSPFNGAANDAIDGATTTADGSSGGAADSNSNDTGSPPPGGGASGGPKPSSPSCATMAADASNHINYCRDFDDGIAIEAGWTDLTAGDDGRVSLDSKDSVTAPGAFFARFPKERPLDDGCAYARTSKSLGQLQRYIHMAFDVKVGGNPDAPDLGSTYMSMQIGDPGVCGIILATEKTAGFIRTQAPDDVSNSTEPVELGAWIHIDVVIDQDLGALSQLINGKAQGTVNLPSGCRNAGDFIVRPGIHCEQPFPEADRLVHIDNLVVEDNDVPF